MNKILAKIALGLTKEQACYSSGVSPDAFENAEKQDPISIGSSRARAIAARTVYLLKRVETAQGSGWKRFAWLLTHNKSIGAQFEDTGSRELLRLQLNQQNNFNATGEAPAGAIMLVGEELDKARARLEETKQRQARRINDVADQ